MALSNQFFANQFLASEGYRGPLLIVVVGLIVTSLRFERWHETIALACIVWSTFDVFRTTGLLNQVLNPKIVRLLLHSFFFSRIARCVYT